MDIRFKGNYEKDHVITAFRLLSKPKKGSNIFAYVISAVYIVACMGIFYMLMTTTDANETDWLRFYRLLIFIPFVIYLLFRTQINNRIMANKTWQTMEKLGATSGYVDEAGIMLISAINTETRIHWHKFVKKTVSPELIALLDAAGTAMILPRTFFESDKDWQWVTNAVHYKVKEISNI